MKRKKKIIIQILLITVFLGYMGYGVYSYNNSSNKLNHEITVLIKDCKIKIQHNDYLDTEEKERCEYFLENEEHYQIKKPNFFVMLGSMISDHLNVLNTILFFIIIIPSIYYLSNLLKNKCLINYYMRQDNNSFIKKILKECYSFSWCIPLALIIFILCCALISDFTLFDGIEISTVWSINTMQNPFLFVFTYMLHFWLYLSFYINLGIIFTKKYHSYIVSVFSSFLTLLGLQIFYEIVIDKIYGLTGQKWLLYLDFMDTFYLRDTYGVLSSLIFPFLLSLISFIIVIKIFKNKERVLIDIETH